MVTGDPRLSLLVLHATDVPATRAFYEVLGLRFADERHGDGPPHAATTLPGGIVLEIYPAPAGGPAAAPRLGFTVPDVDAVVAALGVPARRLGGDGGDSDGGDGGVVVVVDPDGRPVHLGAGRRGRGRGGGVGSGSVGATRVEDIEAQIEAHRRELTGYCYRMLGSAFEADDAVQETMIRAWKAVDRFEGRSSLRSWLYRIATNVCVDALNGRQRRARPVDLSEPFSPGAGHVGEPTTDDRWLGPVPDAHVLDATTADADPAEVAEAREGIRLAFVAALQHLPPRQRAVLILREVLRWRAAEVADVLGTSVASVNSSLQRARARLDAVASAPTEVLAPLDPDQVALLDRYVRAFERYDLVFLASLLHAEATLSLPPYDTWMRGPSDICDWYLGPGVGCQGSRLVPIAANGSPAYGQYRPSGPRGTFEPWAIQVVEVVDGRIAALNCFLDVERLFPLFGLPPTLDPAPA